MAEGADWVTLVAVTAIASGCRCDAEIRVVGDLVTITHEPHCPLDKKR